jgi:hypothetical protein
MELHMGFWTFVAKKYPSLKKIPFFGGASL